MNLFMSEMFHFKERILFKVEEKLEERLRHF